MILTKTDLANAIFMDRKRYNCTKFSYYMGLLYHRDDAHAIRLLETLRKTEFYRNNSLNNNCLFRGYYKIMFNLYNLLYCRLQFKYDTYIGLNCCEPGLWIPHMGGIIINCYHMGCNCSVTKGVVIGNRAGQDNRASIGNNCYFTLGCKVIGKVTIGDNVVVAQNAVVTKDISCNTLVGGIPAKPIKTHVSIEDLKL